MALFKIEKGTAANLTTNRPNAVEGYAYFTTDDGRFYIDITGGTAEEPVTAVVGTNRIPLSADRADRIVYAENAQSSIYYDKTITTSDPFVLKDGSLIAIKFTDSTPGGTTINDDQENNIVGNVITFNVNNTGAKYVHYRGARIPNEYLVQNKIYLFKVTAFTTTQNNQTVTDYRYEMIGDVIPVLPGDETVITDEHGNLITRPFVDSYRVVESLPSEVNVDTNVVYLVPTGESGTGGASSGGGNSLTYTLSKTGSTITLTDSNGGTSTVTDIGLSQSETQNLIDSTITTALSTAYPTA